MKKFFALLVVAVFICAFSAVSFAGGYEQKSSEWTPSTESTSSCSAPAVEEPAASAEPVACAEVKPAEAVSQQTAAGYDEAKLNENLDGAGKTLRDAGKSSGDIVTGFLGQSGKVIEGAGKTTGDVLVGAGKTTCASVKGFFDSAGRMFFGAGESTVKAADNTGKIVVGQEK